MMKAGDIVTVYEDPLTEQKPEGAALLVPREQGERRCPGCGNTNSHSEGGVEYCSTCGNVRN
jgi:hypothetical protein